MIERLWTIEEVAQYLRLKPLTVRGYLRTHKLQGVMIGGHWRVTESALEAFVAAKVAATPAEVAKVQQIAARSLKTRMKGTKGAPEPQD